MKTNNDPVKPKKGKVQTTKAVTVSNKPKKKGPVAKMGELETRFRASVIKLAEDVLGFPKDWRGPHHQRILNKDAKIYNKNRLEEKKQEVRDNFQRAKNKLKVEELQKKGYKKSGFQYGGQTDTSKLGPSNNKSRGMVPTSMPSATKPIPSATKPMAKKGAIVKKTMRRK